MYRNTGKNRYSLVLQEVNGLTKKIPIPNVYCYANVSSSLLMDSYLFSYDTFYSSIIMYKKRVIIINISRSKGVNEKIICLCTSCHENVPACAVHDHWHYGYWVSFLQPEEESILHFC